MNGLIILYEVFIKSRILDVQKQCHYIVLTGGSQILIHPQGFYSLGRVISILSSLYPITAMDYSFWLLGSFEF